MVDYLRKRPMLISAVGCVISAICGFYSFWASGLVFALSLIFLGFAFFKKQFSFVFVWLLVAVMCVCSFAEGKKAERIGALAGSEIEAVLSFDATTYKSESIYNSTFEVLVDGKLKKGSKISLWHEPLNFSGGEIINATVSLRKIDDDYKVQNFSNEIYISGDIEDFSRVEVKDGVLANVYKIRNYIAETLYKNMSKDSAATMCALVFGDKSYLSDEFYGNVKSAGVAHVMVVSGLHLSIIVLLVLQLTEKFVYNPYLRGFIMFCTVVIMCTVCGFTNSILRAGITYIIMALALVLKRPYSAENALGCAVTFILLSSPFTVFSVAFQLSALSTLGILAVALPVYNNFKIEKKIPKYIVTNILISLSALLLTLPVTVYIYGYISNMSVITNLLISFPVTVILSVTVVAVVLSPVLPFISSVALGIIDYGVKYVNFVINYMGSRSFATTRLPQWVAFVAVLVILVVFHLLITCKKRRDMLKLKEMNQKIIKEGGDRKKWQLFLKKP